MLISAPRFAYWIAWKNKRARERKMQESAQFQESAKI